jgi:hypothetical protein
VKKLVHILILSSSLVCISVQSNDLKPEDFKPVLYGRKDLIRNEAINSVIGLCKFSLDSSNLRITSLDKSLHICLDELQECQKNLKERN